MLSETTLRAMHGNQSKLLIVNQCEIKFEKINTNENFHSKANGEN